MHRLWVILLLLPGCFGHDVFNPGERAPDWDLKTLDGEIVGPGNHEGKTVMLFLWGARVHTIDDLENGTMPGNTNALGTLPDLYEKYGSHEDVVWILVVWGQFDYRQPDNETIVEHSMDVVRDHIPEEVHVAYSARSGPGWDRATSDYMPYIIGTDGRFTCTFSCEDGLTHEETITRIYGLEA